MRCSSRSQPAASSSSATFAKVRRPSASSTRQWALIRPYPRLATASQATGAEPVASSSSAWGKRFSKLQPVAIRVEHVQQPNLPVELEDHSDVDAVVAELLGHRLHVLDADVRDGSVLSLRLALGETDLAAVAFELRPATVAVEVGLAEP